LREALSLTRQAKRLAGDGERRRGGTNDAVLPGRLRRTRTGNRE